MNTELSTLAQRVKYLREKQELSQQQLAEMIGADQSVIGNLERRNSQKSKYSLQLANAFGVNLEWLVTGQGVMMKDVSPTFYVNNGGVSISDNGKFNQNFGNVTHEHMKEKHKLVKDLLLYPLPAKHIQEKITLTRDFVDNFKNIDIFALYICDDYLQPIINSNAMVIAEKMADELIYNGKIYVLDMQGIIICRYLEQMSGNRIKIFSEKDKQGEIISKQDFDNEYQIMGRVIWQSSFIN